MCREASVKLASQLIRHWQEIGVVENRVPYLTD